MTLQKKLKGNNLGKKKKKKALRNTIYLQQQHQNRTQELNVFISMGECVSPITAVRFTGSPLQS